MGKPNKILHNCNPGGPPPPNCFNIVAHPKLEDFAECFSNSIAMSNIDGSVEVNGHVLFLEWKRPGEDLKRGQRLMFERLAALSRRIVIMAIRGDPKTMEVVDRSIFRKGFVRTWEPATLASVKDEMRAWNAYAENGGAVRNLIADAIEARLEARKALLGWTHHDDANRILSEFDVTGIDFLA